MAVIWTARIITGLVALFFVFDGFTKMIKMSQSVEANLPLGIREQHIVGISILLLICTGIYPVPQTAVLGAILLTGYLGGSIATHLNASSGWFPISFSVVFGILTWLVLSLRTPQLQEILPLLKF